MWQTPFLVRWPSHRCQWVLGKVDLFYWRCLPLAWPDASCSSTQQSLLIVKENLAKLYCKVSAFDPNWVKTLLKMWSFGKWTTSIPYYSPLYNFWWVAQSSVCVSMSSVWMLSASQWSHNSKVSVAAASPMLLTTWEGHRIDTCHMPSSTLSLE